MLDNFDYSVRDTLRDILGSKSSGLPSDTSWVDDPVRCRNRLYDSHPDAELEIRLLYLAHRMGVPDSLRTGGSPNSEQPQVPLFEAQKLADSLRQKNGLTRRAARWAVGVWAEALNFGIQDRREKFDSPSIISFDAETHPESEEDNQVLVQWNVWGKHDRITLTPPGVEVDSKGRKSFQADRQTSYQLRVHNEGEILHASAIAGSQLPKGEERYSKYVDYILPLRDLLVQSVSFGTSLNRQRIFSDLEGYRESLLEGGVFKEVKAAIGGVGLKGEVNRIIKISPSTLIYLYTIGVDRNTYPAFADMQNSEYLFLKMYVSGFYLISGMIVNYFNIWSYGYKNEKINDKYFAFILYNILFSLVLVIEW